MNWNFSKSPLYKNNQPECVYVITSNFEKLRFYIDNAIEHLEFNLFTLTQEEFSLLYLCLGYENIANDVAKKIKEDSNNPWAWVGLILTLIGLFPVLGSLFKGIFKVILAPIRRFMLKPATKGLKFTGGNIYKLAEPAIESGITELNKFLARPAVKKAIKNAKITNIYKATASKIREVKGMLTKQALLGVFDKLVGYLRDTVKFIDKYASKAIGAKARQMLQTVIDVRNLANQKLGEFLKPVQDFLERLAVRIEKESDQAFKATTNVRNVTQFRRLGDGEELKAFRKQKPD